MYLRNQKEMPVDKNKTGISFFDWGINHRFMRIEIFTIKAGKYF